MNALSVILLSIATILASTHPINSTKPDRPDARIVNGTAATAGQFPYQVSLRSGVLPKHFCGGAIIADRWILTAAQCTVGRRPRSFVAIVGSASLSFGGVKYHIDQSHPHPKYTDNDFNFDIALVRTTKQIHFSQIVQPIALPQGGHIKPHSEVIISGWGNDATYFTQLQYLESLTISSIECKQLVPTANQTLSSLLCHQHESGGACFGDYGGPMALKIPFSEKLTLVGVANWVVECGKGLPDGYARVYTHIDFIYDVLYKTIDNE